MRSLMLARIAGRTGAYVGGFTFTSTEEKLIRLALDPAARGGEISTSALKLVESLRGRGVKAGQIISGAELAEKTAVEKAGETRLSFGKHKGRPIANVPTDYLVWVLTNVASLSHTERRAIRLVLDAEEAA